VRRTPIIAGIAAGAVLGIGGVMAADHATESAEAQSGKAASARDVKITKKISLAAVKRSNVARDDIDELQRKVTTLEGTGGPAGSPGPAGPQGPQGAQGPQGVEGAAGAPGLSGYEVVDSQRSISANGTEFNGLACPEGKRALGGGVARTNSAGQPVGSFAEVLDVQGSYPTADGQWRVVVRNATDAERFYRITVVCATVA
jgi:hypothetical protein